MRLCLTRKKTGKEKETKKVNAIVLEDGYESDDVLVVATHSSDKQWIMDSVCSFYMTPNYKD